MDVFESAPVVANHVPMDHEADLVPHIGMGKDVKPSDVHEQRDQVGIHNEDALAERQVLEGAREGVRSFEESFEGFVIDIEVIYVEADKDAQVNGLVGEVESGPAEGVDRGSAGGRYGTRMQDSRLVPVNPEARDLGEGVDAGGDLGDALEVRVGDDGVVGKGPGGRSGDGVDLVKERVISNNEEKGGQGASLFDPPGDGDSDPNPALQNRADSRVMHEALHDVNDPGGHANFGKDGEQVVVV
jgi:hypothetical protein